ncbi:MAG: TlpA disulfide reductase family protein [Kofleriaceae bacterium]
MTAPVAAAQWYLASVGDAQGTAIPFFLQLPSQIGGEALVATGPDRVRAKLTARSPKIVVEFDILHTKIEATPGADGALAGTWSSTSGSWGASSLSFRAKPVAAPDPVLRFPGAPGPDVTGVWKVQLTKPGELGKLVIARGEGNAITATFAFYTGNLAFVAGNQDGRTIRLSAFDGSSPYLLVGELDAKGDRFTGTWTAGQALAWTEKLTAQRAPSFMLEIQTKLAAARPKLKLPLLDQAPYANHPVIVELGGSWCPACGHASGKLRELREKYASQDLQVVTLAYEFTDDTVYNKQQADGFKAKFKIPWEVIPIDGGLDKYNEILPPEISNIDASGFPITVFVARDGGIEGFHSGFPPEKWGVLHGEALADYDRLTSKIIASPAKP